jgi:hypothetical protein
MPEIHYEIIEFLLYRTLTDEQRADFAHKGRTLGVFDDAPPDEWQCNGCGATYSLTGGENDASRLGVQDTVYFPLCHDQNNGCSAYGWDRVMPKG